MRRASTHCFGFVLPEDASHYEEILITVKQELTNIVINKRKSEISIDGKAVSIILTQEETNRFAPDIDAMVQLRCYASVFEAPASKIWKIPVENSLNDEVLG